ncbi:MAG: GDP-mannose 4,6-dehydratase [Ferruginibacter sp.]|nr:GDP-mannose 4,6-dehydratase [Ferruginibacter sp.]
MKIFITGISGFVARHLIEFLSSLNTPVEVLGIYNQHLPAFNENEFLNVKCKFVQLNLLDKEKVTKAILNFNPNYLIHLAAKSSVALSWQRPGEIVSENSQIFINLIETLRETSISCRMLSIGSAEEYGHIKNSSLPLLETFPCLPVSPYGAARVLQNNLVGIYTHNYGLDLIHTRSFNHIGPYQNENFAIGSFLKQITTQKKQGKKEVTLVVGDIDVIRDFTDVRDVVRAYYLLLQKGIKGETYNVCSNHGYKLREIIDTCSKLTGLQIKTVANANNLRPSENKELIGSYEKLNKETGWYPKIDMKTSLTDLLSYWDHKMLPVNA